MTIYINSDKYKVTEGQQHCYRCPFDKYECSRLPFDTFNCMKYQLKKL